MPVVPFPQADLTDKLPEVPDIYLEMAAATMRTERSTDRQVPTTTDKVDDRTK